MQDKKSTEQHTRKREGHRDTERDTHTEREDSGSCNQTKRRLKLDLQHRAWRDQGREASKERRQPATKIAHNYSTNDLRKMEEKQTSSREEEERDRERGGGGKCLPNTQKHDSSAARREREREKLEKAASWRPEESITKTETNTRTQSLGAEQNHGLKRKKNT